MGLFVRCVPIIALTIVKLTAQSHPDVGHEIVADLQAGKYAEANQLLTEALKQSPHNARLLTLDGLALVHVNKPSQALASFNQALRFAPDYLPALEGAAQIEYETDDMLAVPLLKRILNTHPNDGSTHALLAAIAFKHGDCATAKAEFAASQPGAAETSVLKEFGSCLVAQRRIAEAIPAFQQMAVLQPDNETAQMDLANVEFLAGNYDKVIATLSSMVAKNPSEADAWDLFGEAYQANLNKDKAMAALRKAITINPRNTQYYTDFAYLCLAVHEGEQGIQMLDTGLSLVPDTAPLYVARGILFSELGQYEKGENDFLTAERLNPDVQLISAAKGLTELQENDLPKAEKNARARLAKHPDDAFAQYLLAEALVKQGATPGTPQFNEAVLAATAAVNGNPNLGVARDVLGQLELENGKLDQAIEQSRLAFQLNPNDQTALYHLIVALKKSNQTERVPVLLHQLALLKQRGRTQLQ